MNKIFRIIALAIITSFVYGCNDPKIPEAPQPKPQGPNKVIDVTENGISWYPQEATPNSSLDIYFKAEESSPLYGYEGDVYAHIGIVDGGSWLNVPAEWTENIDKCKMTKVSPNIWRLSLNSDIISWFGADESQLVPQIGIVIRNEDGSKKGLANDFFIPVNDKRLGSIDIKREALPQGMKDGINISSDNSVTFVLYDKDKNNKHYDAAFLVGSFNNWTKSDQYRMNRDDERGVWWIKLNNLDPRKEHLFQYYLVGFGKTIKVADPYSEKVLMPEDKNISTTTYPNLTEYPSATTGPVTAFTINKSPYNWKYSNSFNAPAKENLVIYELLIRDFTDAGNIKSVTANLDYIASLGVNAIELLPVQEFDGNDSWGYNPCFYFALDKAYGTENDYKNFIDECHKRGIAVIFDVVYNHCTGNSSLAKMYWDSSSNKPTENNPFCNVEAPHPFSVFEDFNHESVQTQNYIKRSLKYLLDEYKIDGFRFDLSKGFTQNKSTEANVSNYDQSRINILKSYSDAIKAVKANAYVILEHFAEYREEKALADNGIMLWRNANGAFAQSAMGYVENSSFQHIDAISSNMPIHAWVSFMESHDEERVAYKQNVYGIDLIKRNKILATDMFIASSAFLLLDRGPKMVWQFGELAYDISIEKNGRTGKKPSYLSKKNEMERARVYDAYSKIINFRKSNPEFFASQTPFQWNVSANNWGELRTIKIQSGNRYLYVLGNFDTTNAKEERLPNNSQWVDLLSGAEYNQSVTIQPNTVKIVYTR